MPAHMIDLFDIGELQSSELAPPFDFTKGAPTLRMKLDPKNTQVGQDGDTLEDCETTLYNIKLIQNKKRQLMNQTWKTALP